jgi:hypothetical protein
VFPSKLKRKKSKVKKVLKELKVLKEKLLQQLKAQAPPQKAVETLNSINFCHKHPSRPLLGMLFFIFTKKRCPFGLLSVVNNTP